MYKEIKSCEVCGSVNLKSVLDLGMQPLCDDLIPIGEDRQSILYPIEILLCEKCMTAHQKYQIEKSILFSDSYHYRSRFTNDVLNGMKNLVDSCEDLVGSLRGCNVLDIGCNDGSLLDYFREREANTFGIEPTLAALDGVKKDHTIFKNYFDYESVVKLQDLGVEFDIITFTNVFAHIDDLNMLLANLKNIIGSSTIIAIENHYLGSVVNGNQFDTFYHEHPRTYSAKSFSFIAKKLDRKLIKLEFPKRYGGNIRAFIGAKEVQEISLLNETGIVRGLKNLQSKVNNWLYQKSEQISDILAEEPRIAAKAFPGRASIPIALLNLSHDQIECVYEKPGSLKIGHYVPGTRIPILSDVDLTTQFSNTKTILNLAWHISDEIEYYLKDMGYQGEIVNII